MNLVKAERVHDTNYVIYRHIIGNVEIGVTRVLYGFRVVGGYIDPEVNYARFYECVWCAGRNLHAIQVALNIMKGHLERGGKIKELPAYSRTKPYTKDADFIMTVLTLKPSDEPVTVTAEELTRFANQPIR